MSWRNTLAGLGKVLIAAGVVLLLFVGYQLWGTGLATRSAQNDLSTEFDSQLQAVDELPPTDPTRYEVAESTVANLAPGDPVGRLEIPAIGFDYVVVEGVTLDVLETGPGRFPETSFPGQAGNSAIAGHRATYDAPFNLLDELVPGDEVRITTLQGSFLYEVLPQPNLSGNPGDPAIGHYLVAPTAVEILDDKGDDRLTLMGCHPRYGSSQRIVVEARLVTEPAPTTPAPAGDRNPAANELLKGERGTWGPVIGWSAAVVVAGLAAWWIAQRRRWQWRLAIYLVASPVVGYLLFRSFEAITALNPVAY